MNSYITHLERQYNRTTFKRKTGYFAYNFGWVIKKLSSKSRVLEIGPGMGESINYLRTKGIENISMVDNDANVLRVLEKRNGVRGILSDDIVKIKTKLEKYDLIIMIQVLEHIPVVKYIETLKILYAHLNKGGYILIVVPNAGNPLGLAERYGDIQHTASFTEQSLRDLMDLTHINTNLVKIKGYEIPPYDLINIVRIILQKFLHLILYFLMIVNGGTYFRILTPNIVLEVRK